MNKSYEFIKGKKEGVNQFLSYLMYSYDFPDYDIDIFKEIANEILNENTSNNYDITAL